MFWWFDSSCSMGIGSVTLQILRLFLSFLDPENGQRMVLVSWKSVTLLGYSSFNRLKILFMASVCTVLELERFEDHVLVKHSVMRHGKCNLGNCTHILLPHMPRDCSCSFFWSLLRFSTFVFTFVCWTKCFSGTLKIFIALVSLILFLIFHF